MTDQHEATPRAKLERQIMDPNIPKNEREWWAATEIKRLREEVETWRDRYHAEHQDHEATMKAWDEERSGL